MKARPRFGQKYYVRGAQVGQSQAERITNQSALILELSLCGRYETNDHEKVGASSRALTTFETVFTMTLTEIAEQLPNEVGPSTAAEAAGVG